MRKYVNAASDEDFLLIVAWLVMALRPDGLYPILILQGEEASAKSTASRVLRALIDPQKAPIRAMPKTEHDLVIAATSSWVTAFDNGSSVRDQFSDALCRIATGGGFATRALYTDDEQRIFEQVRPVILNSLDAIATKQDLLDRAIVERLPRIPARNRKDEATFWEEFEADRPQIIAALFRGTAKAPSPLERHQRKPSSGWGTSPRGQPRRCQRSDGRPHQFIAAYEDNRTGALKASLEGGLVAKFISTNRGRVVGVDVTVLNPTGNADRGLADCLVVGLH